MTTSAEGQAFQTVTFGIDGHDYEVDLRDWDAFELRLVLERYVAQSRIIPAVGDPGPAPPPRARTRCRRRGTTT